MPPKRPAPLSDKALVKGDGDAAAPAGAGAPKELPELGQLPELGDTKMTVKNTFIDFPSGLTPTSAAGKPAPLMTAPAQVNASQGFIQRKLEAAGGAAPAAASSLAASSAAPPPTTPLPQTPAAVMPATPEGAPLKLGWPQPSDRQAAPGATAPGASLLGTSLGGGMFPASTPLVTPSPSSNSHFSAARYQLFGGPAPLQPLHEVPPAVGQYPAGVPASAPPPLMATGPPLPPPQVPAPSLPAAPTPVTPLGAAAASTPSATEARLHTTLRSGPFSYGSSTISALTAGAAQAPAAPAAAPVVPPAAPASQPAAQAPAPGGKAEKRREDDSDDDSDEDGQKAPQVGVTGARTAEEAPRPPPGAAHPSLGSENHEEGTCKRCCFFPRNRCLNGYQCEFCHYEHEKRKRKNKKSKKKNKDGDAAAGGAQAAERALAGAAVAGSTAPWAAGVADAGMVLPPGGDAQQLWEMAAAQQAVMPHLDVNYGAHMATTIQQGFAHLGSHQLVTYQWVDGLPGALPSLPPPPNPLDPAAQAGMSVPSIPLMYQQVPSAQPSPFPGYGVGVDGFAMPPPLAYGVPPATEAQALLPTDPAWQPPYPAPAYDATLHQQAAANAAAEGLAPPTGPPSGSAPGAPPALAPEVLQGAMSPVPPAEPPTLPPPPSHEAAVHGVAPPTAPPPAPPPASPPASAPMVDASTETVSTG